MSGDFFANYKEFISIPVEEQKVNQKEFDPQDYASHFILTLSLYDSLISNWREANKYEIEVEKSIKKVLEELNKIQKGLYHFQLLEMVSEELYFVVSLSCNNKIETEDAEERISYIIDNIITNPFYVGQFWFRLIGNKGRIKRKLFYGAYKEYIV